MELIGTIEPTLVIPVLCTLLLAFLVYLFGFQKTQEPSFQQLAVLQSTTKPRPLPKSKPSASGPLSSPKNGLKKEKVLTNGHVKPVGQPLKNDKESQKTPQAPKPKKERKVVEKEEDIDAGDWTAVARKDKKVKPKKEEKGRQARRVPPSTTTTDEDSTGEMLSVEEVMKISAAAKDKKTEKVVQEIHLAPVPEPEPEAPTPTTKAPETQSKKKAGKGAPPKVQDVVEEENIEIVQEPEVEKSKVKAPEANNNVAFDEMGDLWEEAKSRGNKKKARARRD